MSDSHAFSSALRAPDSAAGPALWFAFRGRELLVQARGGLEPAAAPDALGLAPRCTHYLGALGPLHCWSLELAPDAEPPPGMVFRDLRQLYGCSTRACTRWRRARCRSSSGTARTASAAPAARRRARTRGERSRVCTACGLANFPRIAPAVIVAVEKGDEILLGRSRALSARYLQRARGVRRARGEPRGGGRARGAGGEPASRSKTSATSAARRGPTRTR